MSSSLDVWHDDLRIALYDAEDAGKTGEIVENYELAFKFDQSHDEMMVGVPAKLKELYEMFNGGEILWQASDNSEVGGRLKLPSLEQVLQDWEGILFQAEQTGEDERIRHFKPFDQITNEAQCGFLLFSGRVEEEIYYNETGYNQIYGLDLDTTGYLDMALAARLYYYWPKVLLDIQSGEESVETTNFKENMPTIFPDFKWEEFVSTYESLRLSKQ